MVSASFLPILVFHIISIVAAILAVRFIGGRESLRQEPIPEPVHREDVARG